MGYYITCIYRHKIIKGGCKICRPDEGFSVVSMSQESYIDNVYDKLVDDSLKAGVFGLVAPANRPDRLKK